MPNGRSETLDPGQDCLTLIIGSIENLAFMESLRFGSGDTFDADSINTLVTYGGQGQAVYSAVKSQS